MCYLVVVLVAHESAQGLAIRDEQQPQHHAYGEQDDEGTPPAQRGLAPEDKMLLGETNNKM